jgi:hypothetical protein
MGRRDEASATRRRRSPQPLPPPLPPETRTVGQLVAESIRLYGRRFWRCLPLGVAVAVVDGAAISLGGVSRAAAFAFVVVGGSLLLSAAYTGASSLVAARRSSRRRLALACAAGAAVFAPAPFLATVFVFPALAWLALVGLVVPVIVIEELPVRRAFRRALALGRSDYAHALGSLCTLVIIYFLLRLGLFFLLRGGSLNSERVAAFLADVVIGPLLFLGAALLYFDQAARAGRRVGSAPRTRRFDADIHPAVQADDQGRPDAEVESRPAS